ncbi:MAG TPA: ABC transporter permease, partial [Candidatus Binatia bacterium]|nr:ABC transporter permease [Candidatus Binatia bacterium]
MKRYLFQRLLFLLPTLWGALTLVFLLIHLVPGDPIEVMLGETASAADKEELRRNLGLDQSLMVQYRSFLTSAVGGDLGSSLYEQARVSDLIRARLPAT